MRDAGLSDSNANLHLGETAEHCSKTIEHFAADTLIATETSLHWGNAPKHCSETPGH